MLLLDAIKSRGVHLHMVSILEGEANEKQGERDSFCHVSHMLQGASQCPFLSVVPFSIIVPYCCCSFRKALRVEKTGRGVALKM